MICEIAERIRRMKKKIKRIIAIAVVLALVAGITVIYTSGLVRETDYGATLPAYTEGMNQLSSISDDVPVLENEFLTFYTCNGAIAVQNKQSGTVWRSDSNGESLISVSFLDGQTLRTWTSDEQSVQKEQYKAYISDDGQTVRLEFILGDFNEKINVPYAIKKSKFEKLLKELSESDGEYLKRRYTLYTAKTVKNEDNANELLEEYPDIKNNDYYILSDFTGKILKERTRKIFDKLGYTAESAEKDSAESGYDTGKAAPVFRVPIDFKLDGSDLKVNIYKDEIGFYSEYPFLDLELLSGFLGTDRAAQALIPSGSGALIDFAPGSSAGSLTMQYYGDNDSKTDEELSQIMKNSKGALRFPLSALISNDEIVLCNIESGAANASLTVERTAEHIRLGNIFGIVDYNNVYITAKKKMFVAADSMISSDIALSYSFFSTEEGKEPYVTVAERTRKVLTEKYDIKATDNTNPLLMLETVGSVETEKSFLGLFPYESETVLTSFDESQEIADYFSGLTESRTVIQLNGWNKGGLYRQPPGKLKVLGSLGGKRGLESTLKEFSNKNISAYLRVNQAYYYGDTAFDGFSASKYAAVALDNEVLFKKQYDPVEHYFSENSTETMIVSPAKYSKISKEYIKTGVSQLAVGALASSLNSDYSGETPCDRSEALRLVTQILAEYKENAISLSAVGANDYSLKYLSVVENAETESSGNQLFEKDIPFYSIVVHGLVDCVTASDSGNPNDESVLRAIENGYGLKWTFTFETGSEIYKTEYSWLYDTDYLNNRERAYKQAERVQSALSGLQNLAITYHKSEKGFAQVGYSDGTYIYVNYTDKEVSYGGVTVSPMDYVRVSPK